MPCPLLTSRSPPVTHTHTHSPEDDVLVVVGGDASLEEDTVRGLCLYLTGEDAEGVVLVEEVGAGLAEVLEGWRDGAGVSSTEGGFGGCRWKGASMWMWMWMKREEQRKGGECGEPVVVDMVQSDRVARGRSEYGERGNVSVPQGVGEEEGGGWGCVIGRGG